jgi:hypothetical protein
MGLAGVGVLNAAFAAVGFALLRGLGLRVRWFDAGLALVLGAGVSGTAVLLAVIAGARANLLTFALAAVALLGTSIALRRLRLPSVPPPPFRAGAAAWCLGAGVAAVALLGLAGSFRSSPWLDDAWGIWLPKAVALLHHGLDERLFVPNETYVAFEVPDYPLWWSVVTALDLGAVGEIDLRSVNAQLGVLAVGFLAAIARLLCEIARGWIVAAAVALVAFAPEFWRHAQGGMADLPLAIYVSLTALAGALWLRHRRPLHLVLAALFAATAVQVKGEALAEIAVLIVVGLALARGDRALTALAGVSALATALPWLVWQWAHEVPARTPLADAFDPGYLGARVERVGPAARAVVEHVLDPTRWLLVVPLVLVVSAAAAVRTRQLADLAPVGVAAGFGAFLVWAYWANRDELEFLLATSAYRLVDPIVLTAAVLLPFSVERLLRAEPRGASGRAASGRARPRA